jgi:hypothetical protein
MLHTTQHKTTPKIPSTLTKQQPKQQQQQQEYFFRHQQRGVEHRGDTQLRPAAAGRQLQGQRPGINCTKLRFGRKVFGQIFNLQ